MVKKIDTKLRDHGGQKLKKKFYNHIKKNLKNKNVKNKRYI